MALRWRYDPRISLRVTAALVSAVLHVGLLFLLAHSGGRYDGTSIGMTPIARVVLLEARHADYKDGHEAAPFAPAVPSIKAFKAESRQSLEDSGVPTLLLDDRLRERGETIVSPDADPGVTAAPPPSHDSIAPSSPTFVMAQAESSALVQRLSRSAEALTTAPSARIAWEEDGKQYNAEMTLKRAKHGLDFDRVVAEVSAQDRGRQLTTRISFKRLAFSHFTQMIDRWDPMVQLHDDQIVGRFHINSRFNLMYDRRTAPKFLGKVTTAAGGFKTYSTGRTREGDIFRDGIETRVARIDLPDEVQPFAWAARGQNARVHEFARDTHIDFFPDGSYTTRARRSRDAELRSERNDGPVYFIAAQGAGLYVRGIVSGTYLVYSPRRIVVAGALTYAHDPRNAADSPDFLGLVSDRNVEVASTYVTGPGDLDIQAAIFAGRRFVIRDIDHPRTATLRIYGSLAAGTMSASEPRYAMRVEYDSRLDELRPPGFPSTDRFIAENWDGLWTEEPERAAAF